MSVVFTFILLLCVLTLFLLENTLMTVPYACAPTNLLHVFTSITVPLPLLTTPAYILSLSLGLCLHLSPFLPCFYLNIVYIVWVYGTRHDSHAIEWLLRLDSSWLLTKLKCLIAHLGESCHSGYC